MGGRKRRIKHVIEAICLAALAGQAALSAGEPRSEQSVPKEERSPYDEQLALFREPEAYLEELYASADWHDYLDAKAQGQARNTRLYTDVVAFLARPPMAEAWLDFAAGPPEADRRQWARWGGYCRLIANEGWTELLPDVMPHLADTCHPYLWPGWTSATVYLAADREFPGIIPFQRLDAEQSRAVLRKNLFLSAEYACRAAAFYLAEMADEGGRTDETLKIDLFQSLVVGVEQRVIKKGEHTWGFGLPRVKAPSGLIPTDNVLQRATARLRDSESYRDFSRMRLTGRGRESRFYLDMQEELRQWGQV